MALQGKNRHYHFKDIQRRHFNATAARFFQRESAEDVIEEILRDLERAIAAVTARLPADYPDRVATSVFEGLRRTRHLKRIVAAGLVLYMLVVAAFVVRVPSLAQSCGVPVPKRQ